MSEVEIRLVSATECLPLRQRVLKPHLNLDQCRNPGDLRQDTFHLAVGTHRTPADFQVLGCASFEMEIAPAIIPLPIRAAKRWARLRGLAVAPELRRRGQGRQLMREGEKHLKGLGVEALWFNAREAAFEFYQSLGYEFCGETFVIAEIGPHKVMYKLL